VTGEIPGGLTYLLAPEQWAVLADTAEIVRVAAWGGAALAALLCVTLGALFVRVLWQR
jgi:hypothetical protein